jgi:hypothetical protein
MSSERKGRVEMAREDGHLRAAWLILVSFSSTVGVQGPRYPCRLRTG